MSQYAIFFDKDDITIRLPVNPEELEVSSTQAIEKYEILSLGQIAIPSHMELKEYSFEAELPYESIHYIETSKGFQNGDYYLRLLEEWRQDLEPVRFLSGMTTKDGIVVNEVINTLVLIDSLTIKEKAGEERDKYVSFKLIEYQEHAKQSGALEVKKNGKATKKKADKSNPKNKGYYVVKKGDTLWAIAKKYYGNGSKYSKIYNANKKIIKNPSLIYAGQKLVIPS